MRLCFDECPLSELFSPGQINTTQNLTSSIFSGSNCPCCLYICLYIVNTVADFYNLFKIFKIANYKEMLQLDQCLSNLHHQIQSPELKAISSTSHMSANTFLQKFIFNLNIIYIFTDYDKNFYEYYEIFYKILNVFFQIPFLFDN